MDQTWAERKARGYARPHRSGYDLTCRDCGKPIYRGPGSLPQGEACCRDCRARLRGAPLGQHPCSDCAEPAYGERCRPCGDAFRRNGSTPDEIIERRHALEARRRERERSAPGLTAAERKVLKALWTRRRRPCAYCPAPATEIDHVIPLALGGTNYEGNLAPCCGPCNRAKSDNLLAAWKAGKRPRRMRWEVAA